MSNDITTTDAKTGEVVRLRPRNLPEAIALANMMAKSNIVPKEMQGKPENVLISIGMGAEVGLNPFQAVQSIMVVNGRPTIWGDGALGLVRASGLLEKFEEKIEGDTAICAIRRKGEGEAIYRFSMADATKAKLTSKPGPWQDYPKRMLQMRARSWALRDKFADVLRGLSVREEVNDYTEIKEETEITMPEAEQPIADLSVSSLGADTSTGITGDGGVFVQSGESGEGIEFPSEPPADHRSEPPSDAISPKQIGLLMARSKAAGISEERLNEWIFKRWGKTSKSQLNSEELDVVLKRLAAEKK